jgi:hypothetical protein
MLRDWVADCAGLLESTTFAVKLNAPVALPGVPEMTPVLGFMFIPDGRLPDEMLQVYGPWPLVTATVWL